MRKYFNRYISELTYMLAGFYLFAVVYSFANDIDKPVIQTLNSIGVFLSSGGAIVAFFTLINVLVSKKTVQEDEEVKYSNYILLILDRQSRYLKMIIDNVASQDRKNNFNSQTTRLLGLRIPQFDDSLVMPINLEKSLYLLSSESPDILWRLDEAQRDFMYLARSAFDRNDLLINQYNKVIQRHFRSGEMLSSKQVEEKIGYAIIPEIECSTTRILSDAERIKSTMVELNKDLLKLLQKRYPERKFIISNMIT